VPNSKGRTRLPNTKQLHRVLKCKDPTFLDLINRCLTWDATQRITPQEALRHPFFAPARPRAPAMEMPYHPITIQVRMG
jgi:dual specificity tyrosine-phosphorylation-regulated kinase 2/3/4